MSPAPWGNLVLVRARHDGNGREVQHDRARLRKESHRLIHKTTAPRSVYGSPANAEDSDDTRPARGRNAYPSSRTPGSVGVVREAVAVGATTDLLRVFA